MTDVAALVLEARAWAETIDSKPTEEWIKGYVLDGINYIESLCDALEEREREVEWLSKRLEKCHQVARDALNDAEGQPTVVAEPEYKDALDYIEALAARRSQREEGDG